MSNELKEYTEGTQNITMKYAKSLTGNLYSYMVHTVGEFLSCVSKQYCISTVWLALFDPNYPSEDSTDGMLHADFILDKDIVYGIFMNTPTPQLLYWIEPELLNPHLRIENPSFIMNEHEASHLCPSQLDYLAMYSKQMDIFETQLHRLTENGWKRLFHNEYAGGLLESQYENIKIYFNKYAHFIATNKNTIPILTRLLEENTEIHNRELFWRNLVKNESAMDLLEKYPEERNSRFRYLSENPSAIPFIESYLKQNPDSINRFDWDQLSALGEAVQLLSQYPHKISVETIMYNPHPDAVSLIRNHLSPQMIEWGTFCSISGLERLVYIEEHIDLITEEGWKSLCRSNTDGINLLKCYPDNIHWTLLCCNPSPDVIPMIEEFVKSYESTGSKPLISNEIISLLGFSLVKHNIRESYQGKDLWHEDFKKVINLGALSLHPYALPFLEKRTEWIYSNSLSVHPNIYQMPNGTLL